MAHIKDVILSLQVGQRIEIKPDSAILKGVYVVRVQAVDPVNHRVHLSAPMEGGRLVLVPVGTELSMRIGKEGTWLDGMTVLQRTSGEQRSLVMGILEEEYDELFEPTSSMELLTVSSGKGGVGKTTFVVNLAIYLASQGRKVCVLDGDMGTANVDVVLNLAPKYNLTHVLSGECGILDVLVQGPNGISVLPGGSGIQELTELDEAAYHRVLREFGKLEEYIDMLVIDTSSGLARSVTNFIVATGRAAIVCTPEPHAITDAYALMKVIARQERPVSLDLVVNKASSEKEAKAVYKKVAFASEKFLGLKVKYGGFIYEDRAVQESVKSQSPFVLRHPKSRVARCIADIARVVLAQAPQQEAKEEVTVSGFFGRMRSLFASR